MWKIVLVLLAVTAVMAMARLLANAPAIQTRAGMMEAPAVPLLQTTYAYAGVRG